MTRSELIFALSEEYGKFSAIITSLCEDDFMFSLNGQKWTAGQQLDHLYRSVSPLNLALGLPRFALRAGFGKAIRPSRSFDEVVAKYQSRLAAGGKASGRFIPKRVEFDQRDKLTAKLKSAVAKLCTRVENFSEDDLGDILLPHPILGKITLREMLYFTIYHAGHHQKHMLNYLESR